REAGLADVPGLGEVNARVFSRRFRDPSSSRRGRPLRPPFNAQLRTGTD
ncbi:hypothetical protein ALC60_00916, partial [Trachymyrmex zeteki]